MNKGDLKKLFNPSKIAIIGASEDEKKIGNIVVRNLDKFGYKGDIFLVNPHLPHINGHSSFSSYDDIPTVPDLAIITTPAITVPDLIESIAKKGTKNALVFAAGFKESGEGGESLQKELIAVADKFGVNILGPNCLGFINYFSNINATFGSASKYSGNIRFISQSGAIATGMFDWSAKSGVGFSEFITIGNKANINENNILEYWMSDLKDDKFKKFEKDGYSKNYPIGLYLESISDGKKLVELTTALSKKYPIVVLKPGKTEAASKAMLSHTGSIAGNDKIFSAAMSNAGVMRAEGIEDMFDLLKAFSWENAPSGPNVAIVSNAGGPAVITADALKENKLTLANLSKSTNQKLEKLLPREAAIHNPVDVLGDADANRYLLAVECVLKDKNVDSAVVILTPQAMTQIEETAKDIALLSKKYKKTIICSFIGGMEISQGEIVLNEAKIPSFRYPERAIKALGKMYEWNQFRSQKIIQTKKTNYITNSSLVRINNFLRKIKQDRNILSGFEASEVLFEAGVSMPPYSLVTGYADAVEFAHRYEYPIALKITSPHIVHKTDIGGVFPKIVSSDELAIAIKKLSKIVGTFEKNKKDAGIIVQKNISDGVSVIVGIKQDEVFGKFLMIGSGGIYANLLEDQKIILLPRSQEDLVKLIKNTKIGKILDGYRNKEVMAIDKLVRIIAIIDELTTKCAIIKEVEINPLIVTSDEAFAVDIRIFI